MNSLIVELCVLLNPFSTYIFVGMNCKNVLVLRGLNPHVILDYPFELLDDHTGHKDIFVSHAPIFGA